MTISALSTFNTGGEPKPVNPNTIQFPEEELRHLPVDTGRVGGAGRKRSIAEKAVHSVEMGTKQGLIDGRMGIMSATDPKFQNLMKEKELLEYQSANYPIERDGFMGSFFNAVQMGPMMAGTIMAMMPVLIVFFFAQKYFVQGIVVTGVKG